MDSNTRFEMKMDKEYILKEGILEAYLLGELSSEQEQQVFQLLQSDAELMNQYKDLEKSLENLAFENAVAPPNTVKENILAQINNSTKPEVVPLESYKRYFRIVSAVAAVFVLTSLVLWMSLNSKEQELKLTLGEQETLVDSIEVLKKASTQTAKMIAYVNDPETERFVLKGNKLAPDASILSYINHEQKSVFINIHKLPALTDKDYQMWADVDGEMIDMGVIDTSKKMLSMNYIKNAESINITIEKKGGSDHPNVSQLIGSVAI